MITIYISLMGVVGAWLRYGIDYGGKRVLRRSGYENAYPLLTLGINVFGSGLAGGVMGSMGTSTLSAVLLAGFCGGFTTLSTASVETVLLLRDGRRWWALGYVLLTAVLAVLACAGGWWLVAGTN